MQWDIARDCFQFEVTLRDKPSTRRRILSLVSSVYDPLGFIAPFTLLGRFILRMLCKSGVGWDDAVDAATLQKWEV